MPLSDPDLWRRLQGLAIGPQGAMLPFSDRLARDNAWTRIFAARVVEEYRRFLYLCCVAGQPVTPSDEVDQAWHLHLTYTRAYWDELCDGVLGRPLHHAPTGGGPEERRKYDVQYRATLEIYALEFGEVPPADIWPDVAIRFGKARVRIDPEAVWMIDRDRFSCGLRHVLAAALCLGLGACAQMIDDLMAMSLAEQALLVMFIGMMVVGIVRWALMIPDDRKRQRAESGGCGSGSGEGCGSGCD